MPFYAEADPGRGWGWRVCMFRGVNQVQDTLHHLNDSGVMRIETRLDLAFKRCQFAGQNTGFRESGAHFYKGAHHVNTHFHGTFTVEHISCHKRAVLGKDAG